MLETDYKGSYQKNEKAGLSAKGLSRNKVYRIDEVILFFFKAQIEANSRRLLAKFATQKKDKRTSQNVKVILGQVLNPTRDFKTPLKASVYIGIS